MIISKRKVQPNPTATAALVGSAEPVNDTQ